MFHARNNAIYICWILSRVSASFYQPFRKELFVPVHAFPLPFSQPFLFLWFIPIHFPVILIIIGHSSGAAHHNVLNLITCTLNLLGDIKNSSKWKAALNTARRPRLLTFLFFCRTSFQNQFLSFLWRNSETECRFLF